MLCRLAIIASVLVLSACQNEAFAPTDVSLTRGVDDGGTVPQGLCDDSTVEQGQLLIPLCTDGPYWPEDMFRLRHERESLTVRSAGGGAKGRLY